MSHNCELFFCWLGCVLKTSETPEDCVAVVRGKVLCAKVHLKQMPASHVLLGLKSKPLELLWCCEVVWVLLWESGLLLVVSHSSWFTVLFCTLGHFYLLCYLVLSTWSKVRYYWHNQDNTDLPSRCVLALLGCTNLDLTISATKYNYINSVLFQQSDCCLCNLKPN